MKRNPIFLITGIALFIGIVDMPYGYYQLLKFFVCGVGVYGAYLSYEQKKIRWAWILGIIALLFNPFYKFYFAKETWKTIDFIAGVIFLFSFGKEKILYVSNRLKNIIVRDKYILLLITIMFILFELAAFNAKGIHSFLRHSKTIAQTAQEREVAAKLYELREQHPEYSDLDALTLIDKMAKDNPKEYQRIYETLKEMHKRALAKGGFDLATSKPVKEDNSEYIRRINREKERIARLSNVLGIIGAGIIFFGYPIIYSSVSSFGQ